LSPLYSPEIWQRVGATGTGKTVKVEIVHDGASAFKDNEVWLEVMYLGNTSDPGGTWITDSVDVLQAGSAQTTSVASPTWTGATGTGENGSSTWNKLELGATGLTLNPLGYIVARVAMAVASKTLFVDPVIRIT